MAAAFVQAANASHPGTTALTATFANPVATGHNVKVAVFMQDAGGTITSVVDSKGKAFTLLDDYADFSPFHQVIAYGENVEGGSGYGVTANFSGGFFGRVVAHEVKGVAASSSLDIGPVQDFDASSSTPDVAGSTTVDDTYVFACINELNGDGETFTAGSGFTLPTNGQSTDATNKALATIYQVKGAAGSVTAGFNRSGDGGASIQQLAAFKAATDPRVTVLQTANPAGVSHSANVTTYSSVSIGAADAGRIVAVLVGGEVAADPSSATIDFGSGATAMSAGTLQSFGSMRGRIFYAPAPTGTTATIAITWSAAVSNTQNHIAVYSVLGADEVLDSEGGDTSTDMDATDPLTTGSITIPTGGVLLAVAVGATDTVGKTWANAAEDLDVDAGGFRFTTATRVAGSTTVTCTGGTNNEDGALAYVIFKVAEEGGTEGTAAVTLAGITIAASASQRMVGAGAIALAPAAIAAQGFLQPAGVGAINLAAATIAGAAAQSIPGAGALTLAAPVIAGQAAQTIPGAGALELLAATIQASGIMQPSGAAALALQPVSIAAQAAQSIVGVGAIDLAAVALAASGAQGQIISATGAIELAAVTLAAAGLLSVPGAAALSLSPVTLAAAGLQSVPGAGAISLQPVTIDALAAHFVGVNGVGAVNLSPVAIAAAGLLGIPGASAIVLSGVTIDASALVIAPVAGTAAISLGPVSIAGNGALSVQSAAAINLLAAQIAAQGSLGMEAAGAVTLSPAQIAAIATFTAPAALGAIVLPGIVIASESATDIVVLPSELLGAIELNPAILALVGLHVAVAAVPSAGPAVAGELDL